MSDVAIRVEDVTKVFRIYDRPGDRLREAFFFGRRKLHTDFHALRGITFEVRKGEFLGVVGRNGAGKSTILRILSGELTPTAGAVFIEGKVSLLQLGVGFDPELTGMDNARFASKLLGYSDDQIDRLMQDIIEFAELGEFMGHPVKTYSSGMYSRLSFAVGVNIDPDILIADEVLSVGDMRFSQKCLRKMREFKDRGKTVVFVSHDIHSLNAFCDSAMWVKEGQIHMRGECRHVTLSFQNYMLYGKLPDERPAHPVKAPSQEPNAPPIGRNFARVQWVDLSAVPCLRDGRADIRRMAFVLADTLEDARSLRGNEEVMLLLDIHVRARMENPQIGFVIYNHHGLPALHTNNESCGTPIEALAEGRRLWAKFRFKLPALANGSYLFSLGVQTGLDMAHKVDGVYEFRVERGDTKGSQCGYVIIEQEQFTLSELASESAAK